MFTVISSLPILLIIYLMIFQHWNGLKAGLAGWAAGCTIGFVWFGLTPQVLWVSQLKGLYLSFFVLAILWPALFLFQTVKEIGGIQGIVDFLNETLVDQDLLVVGLSWAFSGMLEGLAGFGLPIAIVAPMLVGLGVKPLYAVAAVAVGHSWSVTFGDMGVIYQTLLNLTGLSSKELVLPASILLGSACLACGLGAVFILNRKKVWFKVVLISIAMGFIQYLLAAAGILPLSAFGAGFSGMVLLLLWSPRRNQQHRPRTATKFTLLSYGGLSLLMAVVYTVPQLNSMLSGFRITFFYPSVQTRLDYITQTSSQTFEFVLHPGFSISIIAILSILIFRSRKLIYSENWIRIKEATADTALPTSIAILVMVGLSSLMEHSGMMFTIAQSLSQTLKGAFPLISPFIGIIGAFATGSNNNSNVMFAQLQQTTAELAGLDVYVIAAAQTAGGSLGSLLAPAKIIVGCSTVGAPSLQGSVLKRTLPYGIAIGMLLGLIAFLMTR